MVSPIQQLIDMGIHLPINVPNYFGLNGTIRFPRQLDKISLKYDNVLNEFVANIQPLVKNLEYFMIVKTPESFEKSWTSIKAANELAQTLSQDTEEFTALFEGLRYCLDGLDHELNQLEQDEADVFAALAEGTVTEVRAFIKDFFEANDRPTDDRLRAEEVFPDQK